MNKIVRISLLFITNLISLLAIAQINANIQQDFQLTIQPTKVPIKLDGILDEPAWNTVEAVSQFYKNFLMILERQKANRGKIFIR